MERLSHILSADQFDRDILEVIFKKADKTGRRIDRIGADHLLLGRVMASLFYEPSTRTRLSFEAAMHRLGGDVIGTESAGEFSSAAKGESLEDSIRIVGSYSDVIVLRHPDTNAAVRAANASSVPVINAGSGAGEHPTQALLDVYTIQKKLGRLDNLTVALAGDLKYGRTINSLVKLLSLYENIRIIFVSSKQLRADNEIKKYLVNNGIYYRETDCLDSVAPTADVIYQTRLQRERFKDTSPEFYESVKNVCAIDKAFADSMKEGSIIMHPLPRLDELSPEVDDTDRAVYFDQAYYGLLVRMAALQLLVK